MRMKVLRRTLARLDQLVLLILILNAQLISNCLSLTSHHHDDHHEELSSPVVPLSSDDKATINTGNVDEAKTTIDNVKNDDILDDITEISELNETEKQRLIDSIMKPVSDEVKKDEQPTQLDLVPQVDNQADKNEKETVKVEMNYFKVDFLIIERVYMKMEAFLDSAI